MEQACDRYQAGTRGCGSGADPNPDPSVRMFLGLLNPDPDPLVRGMDPDLSIIKQK